MIIGAVLGIAAIVVGIAMAQGSKGQPSGEQGGTGLMPTTLAATPSPTPTLGSRGSSPSTASTSEPAATPTTPPTTLAPPLVPKSDYLFDLTPTDGSFQVGSKPVNGQTYARSVFHGLSECNPGDGKGQSVEYNLGRRYAKFTATAGLSDVDTRGTRTVQFRIDTDLGHDDFTAGRGEAHRVSFDIRGALYLRLTVYEQNGSGPCVVDTVAVFGDAQIHR